jgi:predicted negative regulator of RcsB-dependent stress response
MNTARFEKELGKLNFMDIESLIPKARDFDQQNGTTYALQISLFLAKQNDDEDEPVPFDFQLFPSVRETNSEIARLNRAVKNVTDLSLGKPAPSLPPA